MDIHLKPGQEIWKKAHNMWKPKNSDRCYQKAICTEGSVLTHKSGDTHYCKPGGQADQCKGTHRSLPGGAKKVGNQGATIRIDRPSWVFYGIGGCYNKRDFPAGKQFACNDSVVGDPLRGSFKACYVMTK